MVCLTVALVTFLVYEIRRILRKYHESNASRTYINLNPGLIVLKIVSSLVLSREDAQVRNTCRKKVKG